MPLDVGGDVLEIVQRVCNRALNVATASAKSSALGPKAGMRALRGRTVKHLPGGERVVKDRALKPAVADARDRWRSSWLRFPATTRMVVAALHDPLDSGENRPLFTSCASDSLSSGIALAFQCLPTTMPGMTGCLRARGTELTR